MSIVLLATKKALELCISVISNFIRDPIKTVSSVSPLNTSVVFPIAVVTSMQTMSDLSTAPLVNVLRRTLNGKYILMLDHTHKLVKYMYSSLLSELNFERVDLNGPCTAVPGYPYPPEPPEVCPELGNYSYTAG